MNPILAFASILHLYALKVVGSKVLRHDDFLDFVTAAIASHDPSKDRAPGQHFIALPPEANETVSGGVGISSPNPEDYVLAEHRGHVSAFLKRSKALPVKAVHVVVYTLDAYLADPEITLQERARVESLVKRDLVTHFLVAVLASSGEQPALSPYRFTANLAGGNNEAALWSADEIRAKAKSVMEYSNTFSSVAD